jgi:predicted  nucleic acid-binding Zn-ribbon protein
MARNNSAAQAAAAQAAAQAAAAEEARRAARRNELNSQISQCRSRVDGLEIELNELKKQLERVSEALDKHGAVDRAFQNDGGENMQTVYNLRNFNKVKLARDHAEVFCQAVNGSGREQDAIANMRRCLLDEKERLEWEIQKRESEILDINSQIQSLYSQLNAI